MTDNDEAPPQDKFFGLSGTGRGIWEINRPQKVILELVERDIFHGEILDIGCGIADNAIHISTHAKDAHITGIDMVPEAIEVAREKAQKNNANIQFEVVNMLDDVSQTNLKHHSYDMVLDSATFHVFSNEDRLKYMKNLEKLIKPGGLYIQIACSEKEERQTRPRRIKQADLNELFSPTNGWIIKSTEDTIYEATPDCPYGTDFRSYLSFIQKAI
ncbi:unnamed protein product [Adineta steineri]|uniref:Methyltransferase domain-containing protein n=1 Tax=Adineta steineri TaxID=433720 RepID=A0A813U918_9BILA|nr:unnamed protein product [Adineta steineri]CAF3719822.1 unnamed protein product [Adineta steineri]